MREINHYNTAPCMKAIDNIWYNEVPKYKSGQAVTIDTTPPPGQYRQYRRRRHCPSRIHRRYHQPRNSRVILVVP